MQNKSIAAFTDSIITHGQVIPKDLAPIVKEWHESGSNVLASAPDIWTAWLTKMDRTERAEFFSILLGTANAYYAFLGSHDIPQNDVAALVEKLSEHLSTQGYQANSTVRETLREVHGRQLAALCFEAVVNGNISYVNFHGLTLSANPDADFNRRFLADLCRRHPAQFLSHFKFWVHERFLGGTAIALLLELANTQGILVAQQFAATQFWVEDNGWRTPTEKLIPRMLGLKVNLARSTGGEYRLNISLSPADTRELAIRAARQAGSAIFSYISNFELKGQDLADAITAAMEPR